MSPRFLFRLPVALCALTLTFVVPPARAAEKTGLPIGDGTVAAIQYTLKDDKGAEIETSEDTEPVSYVHGESNVVPGLKKALAGMHAGDERDVKVTPEDGFGKVDPKAFQEVPKDKIPADAQKVGAVLQAHSPDGVTIPVRVSEVKKDTAVIDFNHPLAGKTLVFHVRVLDVKKVEAAPAQAAPPGTKAATDQEKR